MVQLHATSPHHHPCPSSLQALTVSPQTPLSTPRGSPPFRCLELSSQQHARHLASRPRSEPRIAGVRILLFSGRSFPFSYVLCLHFHLGTPAVPLWFPFFTEPSDSGRLRSTYTRVAYLYFNLRAGFGPKRIPVPCNSKTTLSPSFCSCAIALKPLVTLVTNPPLSFSPSHAFAFPLRTRSRLGPRTNSEYSQSVV